MNLTWQLALLLILPMLPAWWSIWHIWNHSFPDPAKKSLWLLLVVFLPVFGALIYIFTGRKKAIPKI